MKQKNFFQSLIICIALSMVGVCSLWLSSKVFPSNNLITLDSIKGYIIPVITVFIIYKAWGEKYIHTKGSIAPALWVDGKYIFISASILCILTLISTNREIPLSMYHVVCYATTCFLTAIFEELLYRGFIQGVLMRNAERGEISKWTAIVVASVIFGLTHFVNLIEEPNLVISTISQVFYTIFLGVGLGVAYEKSKTLLTPVILHAAFNFLASFVLVYIKPVQGPVAAADMSIVSMVIQLIILLPILWYGRKQYKSI